MVKLKQLLIIAALCLFCGCASYYRVTDPSTGNTYYTNGIKKTGGGSIRIEDRKTGKTVTIQNSEVEKIGKEEFNVGVYSK